jgi:hypothetical protein
MMVRSETRLLVALEVVILVLLPSMVNSSSIKESARFIPLHCIERAVCSYALRSHSHSHFMQASEAHEMPGSFEEVTLPPVFLSQRCHFQQFEVYGRTLVDKDCIPPCAIEKGPRLVTS